MPHSDVSRFITLALDDEAVRQKLETNPDQAFQGYDLSEEEKSAISAGDEQGLRALGIDPMTARSWAAFHDVKQFAPDMPNVPGDLPPHSS